MTWLDERLAASGIRRTGEVSQPHLRPWATALRAPTDRGPVWLKASGPETAFEVALYQLLERVAPERVLAPIATDPGRGWMVLPDGGVTLGERLDELDPAEAMVVVLPEYGRLQRDLGPHVDELLRLGLADSGRRSCRGGSRRRSRRSGASSGAGRGRPRDPPAGGGHAGAVRGVVRPAGGAVGASLDHNDLHYWNVFVDGSVRFYDWGDSVVAHPFASMLLGLGMLRRQLEVGADDPAVVRPRDAYLEVFGDLASRAELVEELELAARWARSGGR